MYDLYLLFLIVGIIAYVLIIFTFLTGKKIIKVRKFRTHKHLGLFSFIAASLHGLYMIYINFF